MIVSAGYAKGRRRDRRKAIKLTRQKSLMLTKGRLVYVEYSNRVLKVRWSKKGGPAYNNHSFTISNRGVLKVERTHLVRKYDSRKTRYEVYRKYFRIVGYGKCTLSINKSGTFRKRKRYSRSRRRYYYKRFSHTKRINFTVPGGNKINLMVKGRIYVIPGQQLYYDETAGKGIVSQYKSSNPGVVRFIDRKVVRDYYKEVSAFGRSFRKRIRIIHGRFKAVSPGRAYVYIYRYYNSGGFINIRRRTKKVRMRTLKVLVTVIK